MWDALIRAIAALWKKTNDINSPTKVAAPPASSPNPSPIPKPINPAPSSVPPQLASNPLAGKPLRYLIGADTATGKEGEVTEIGYDAIKPTPRGVSIKYCNLFDEKNTGKYGPYLHDSDTAQQYGEGQIDPKGEGWRKNIVEQLTRAKDQGFEYVEWDNPDAYPLSAVLNAVSLSDQVGLKVIAKNPLLIEGDPSIYLRQCWGAIVEKGAGSPDDMHALRVKALKPDLPVWFVSFGDRKSWANEVARQAKGFRNMSVTHSTLGEYGNSIDYLLPNSGLSPAPPPVPTPAPPPVSASEEPVPYGAEYLERWRSMAIHPEREADVTSIATRLLAKKVRYQEVERQTGVPWYVIAILHERESGADFNTYLGNGDPLSRPTVNVPAHRGPFSSFEAGAVDALRYDGLDKIRTWPIERIAYECEKFNGFGYRQYHNIPSPYLWSFSNIYKSGKYVSDGEWSSSAVDQQCGTMPMLQKMAELDPSIPLNHPASPAPIIPRASGSLLDKVVAGMEAKGYRLDKEPGQINIAYAEGHNRDGSRNANRIGYWDDVRMVFTYVDGKPVQKGAWTATTQPGPYYTESPINSGGAANIFPGQYTAWKVGLHRGEYEALVQRGNLKLTRDKNKDYKREGDAVEVGDYEGINHHHGSNASEIGPHSAGCLVGQMVDGHEDFMAICKTDPRYKADHDYMFTAAILMQSEVPL